ncbi:MAG: geranylgeranylglyceryl/heptaprenylglyceryl phosphate synthase [Candidatus Micrarchaeia archaeon]|jgi:phosphoglycerol geranylgeranyltransferase
MKPGKVEKYIYEVLSTKGAMLFTLIDPVDYQNEEDVIKVARIVYENGADTILVGGSVGVQGEELDAILKKIRENVDIPIVLFPGNIATISKFADAMYFMILLNSRNPYWISTAQALAAPVVKKLGIEAIPVSYILVSPGGSAGWVGDANLLPRERPKLAVALALAGEMLGTRFVILDTGSGPKDFGYGHIPNRMINEVKQNISIPLIVGGGITTKKELKEVLESGADIVQVGTALQGEKEERLKKKIEEFSKVIKEVGKRKV